MKAKTLCLYVVIGVHLCSSVASLAAQDQPGDALPPGAVARLGTTRWRHGGTVLLASLLPDGKTVVTVSEDRTVRLWEFPSGKELRRLAQPDVDPAPDGFARSWRG